MFVGRAFFRGQLGEAFDAEVLITFEARSGGNQVSQQHVFLQANQIVALAGQRGGGEHLGRLLERSRGDERMGLQAGLGDALKDGQAGRRLAALFLGLGVDLVVLDPVGQFTDQEGGIAGGNDRSEEHTSELQSH